jgi:hypothetical protein
VPFETLLGQRAANQPVAAVQGNRWGVPSNVSAVIDFGGQEARTQDGIGAVLLPSASGSEEMTQLSLVVLLLLSPTVDSPSSPSSAGASAIVSSTIVDVGNPWCDGAVEHQTKSLLVVLRTPAGPTTEHSLRLWDQLTGSRCSEAAATRRKMIQSLRTPHSHAGLRLASGGLCVCGFNSRYECDAGGYRHAISDCYDSDTNSYCGYDDQVVGRCDK